jgi:carbon-monoxide dehydrogenase small subunit
MDDVDPGVSRATLAPLQASPTTSINVTVNGISYRREVEPRLLLSDFLRQELGLTGTHVGCEHGVCGACTILFDAEPVRSCIMLAVQADGHEVQTVESLAVPDGGLNPLQSAFRAAHGLQCGFCTPGILMTLTAFLRDHPHPTDDDIRDALSANLCRCTGYQHIVEATKLASRATVP